MGKVRFDRIDYWSEVKLDIVLDGDKVDLLKKMVGNRTDVTVHTGGCNQILLSDVFPRCRFGDYHRALCLLDPYALNVSWEVLETAGKMGSIEIFYNFIIMDANRNVLWKNLRMVPEDQKERMDAG